MVYSIQWTNRASADIAAIYKYYCLVAGVGVAQRRLAKIKKAISCLDYMPYIGMMDESIPHTPSYRYIVSLDYKIYYFVEEDAVYISAIWDCRQGSRVFG